jgi:hypothetical protein
MVRKLDFTQPPPPLQTRAEAQALFALKEIQNLTKGCWPAGCFSIGSCISSARNLSPDTMASISEYIG